MAGVPSNVNLADNLSPNIIASVTVLWAVGIAAVVLRFVARRKSGQKLLWDDWLVFFAWVLFSATCIANYVAAYLGAGKHLVLILETAPENIEPFLKYIYSVETMYPWTIAPMKWSILFLYVRIFGVNRPFRYYCYFLMVLTLLWAIGLEFGTIFQCTPIWQAWNPESTRTMCVDLEKFLVGANVPNIVLDFLILTAPLRLIWQLNLPTKRKVMVSSILMLGAGETIFSAVRLAVLTSLDTSDPTYNYFGAIVWSTVEEAMGILCVCLPVLGPLMPAWLIGRSAADSGGRGSSGYYKHDHSASRKSEFALQSRGEHYGENSSAEGDDWGKDDDTKRIRKTTEFQVNHGRDNQPPKARPDEFV